MLALEEGPGLIQPRLPAQCAPTLAAANQADSRGHILKRRLIKTLLFLAAMLDAIRDSSGKRKLIRFSACDD